MEIFILKVAENKIKENLDDKVTYHGRKWLQIPRCGNMYLFRLSSSKLGLASYIKYIHSEGERVAKKRSTSYGGRGKFSGINYVRHKCFSKVRYKMEIKEM